MNQNRLSDPVLKSSVSDYYYNDEINFRDLRLSGSMSRSLKALNNYVKKNIFYDESEDPENDHDSDYYSKETSPNDSVSLVKSDSESVLSEVSSLKDKTSNIPHTTEDSHSKTYNDPTTLTDDYKFNKLIENASKTEPPLVIDNSNHINNDKELKQPPVPSTRHSISTPLIEEFEAKEIDVDLEKVTLRTKNISRDNRHTVHDVSEWVNRTDIYPDVYAPLPYKSPNRRYIESDVNIHYRCPVRHDPLPLVPERELARQQADHMKRLYREQRRNKYLQELQDMQNRRHQDNFMPSQKTIVPLNRYDEAERIVAKALYTFNGQTSRELSFRKGDIINVRRQIDSNWYEGEVHGKVGLFPYNYVELMKGDGVQTLKKTAIVEGRAKAKFDFTAQTNLELPLKKGEVVVLTRRIDHNWWEGRTGNKTGIFPDSYVTILQEPSQSRQEPEKPAGTPAAHGLMNGDRPTSHRYTPQHNSPALSNAPPATAPLPSQGYIRKSSSTRSADLNNTEPLYVDTNAEAVPYRAMYKYRPQNPDELELMEGETVYVLEKCDDGWYVGSSQRTGRFGTFPGEYSIMIDTYSSSSCQFPSFSQGLPKELLLILLERCQRDGLLDGQQLRRAYMIAPDFAAAPATSGALHATHTMKLYPAFTTNDRAR
ncbi:unnamed protein product [Danaus chrysippus]|uniref:(African queen) hypothetical protein n=1 Tax=Danaus chrysippus TaxID=151541 RepID=A0A8J2QH49_9NEOP|nr:unnamed protein product [Danaus chrysippus]